MSERTLALLLTARNTASGPVKAVTRDVSTLDRVAGRAGKGIRTLGSNLKLLGAGIAVGAVAVGFNAIKSGLDSLEERQNVISATNAAIEAQGAKAKVTAGEVRNWSEELERATGAAIDDKAIQAGANTLIRFGSVSHDIFRRALADATDLGAGLKTGPEEGAKLLGKALSDPIKGMAQLRRAGVVLTDAEQKRIKQLVKGNKAQEAQVALLEAVEQRYKGAARASAGPYARAQNLLADAAEDAKMALAEGLLPVLTKVADMASGALSDPKNLETIRAGGLVLAESFDSALAFAQRIPWSSIADAMQVAGTGARAALDFFAGLPPWVQTAVLTGWGLNKLTGGALGGIVGELGRGLIKGVLGMTAGVVHIKAGTVIGGGGGSGPGTPTPTPGGGKPGGPPGKPSKPGGPRIGGGAAFSLDLQADLAPVLTRVWDKVAENAEKQGLDQVAADARKRAANPLSGWFGSIPNSPRAAQGRGGLSPDERQARNDLAKVGLAMQRAGERGGQHQARIEREMDAVARITSSTAPSIKSAESHLAQIKALEQQSIGGNAELRALLARLERTIASGLKVNVTTYTSAADNARNYVNRRRTVKPAGSRGSLAQEFG